MNRRGQALIAMSVIIFIYTFATSIMQYNLAIFTGALAQSYTLFGIIMGLPWLFSLLTDIPVGAFADRFGYKRTIILGLLGLSLSGFLLYTASNFIQLFWVLVIFGVFEGLLTVSGMALVIMASSSGKENQFVGGYTTASSLGYVVGPFAGGLIVAWFGNGVPFLLFGAICLFAVFVAIILLKEGGAPKQKFFSAVADVWKKDKMYVSEFREFFSVGKESLLVGAFMLLVGMWSEFIWAMEPLFIHQTGASAVAGGIILSCFVIPFALFDYAIGRWIDRTQKRFLSILLGLILAGSGILLFSSAHSPLWFGLFAALASMGFAFFYVSINGIFDSLSDHHRRGHMTGVWQAAEDIGFVLGPVVGGIVADILGMRGAFVVFGLFFIAFTLPVIYARKNIKRYESR
ncbi:MAG: MFS transporter [Candidatus Sungbacteria bacterium]|nr:MFS transporter [Candidatus Sungbacteria bacterium]